MAKTRILWEYLVYFAQYKGLIAEKVKGRIEVTNNNTGETGVYNTCEEAYAAMYYGEI